MNHQEEAFIVDKSLKILHFNRSFENLMKRINPKGRYDSLNNFLNEQSCSDLQLKINESIKDQKCNNIKIDLPDRPEAFQFNLQPTYWRGAKSVMVVLHSITDTKMKQKLIINQSDEISNQFHFVISTLEKELAFMEEDQRRYSIHKETLKGLLLSSNKCFNDFLFIKNIFEFDSGDFRESHENFSIKDFFIYSVNLLLNKTEQRNVNLVIDPCLPEEVHGDLMKFRQIITSILEFSLKKTEKIDVQIQATFVMESGGYIIEFKISFFPQFELKEDELMLIFSNSEDDMTNQYKIDKNFGLPIYVISKLIKSCGGSFKEIKKGLDDKISLKFSLPFAGSKSSKNIVKTPKIKLATMRESNKNGNIVLKSPYDNFQRTIRSIGSDLGSEKSFPGLPQIEE